MCQATTHEMDLAIAKINENKTIDIQGYGLDKKAKKLVYAKSEMFLTELMEDVCKKVDDYLKATYRDTQKLTIIKMSHDENQEGKGTLSDEVGLVEFVQDGDLNRSLPVVVRHFEKKKILYKLIISTIIPTTVLRDPRGQREYFPGTLYEQRCPIRFAAADLLPTRQILQRKFKWSLRFG